jgi:hypothetical protein
MHREKIYFVIPFYELRNYYKIFDLESYRYTRIFIHAIYFDIVGHYFGFNSFLVDDFTWGQTSAYQGQDLTIGFIQEASSLRVSGNYAIIRILMWFNNGKDNLFVKLYKVFYNLNTNTFFKQVFDRPNQFEVRDVHSLGIYTIEAYASADGSKRYDLSLYDDDLFLISPIININTKEMFRLPITHQDNYSVRIIKIIYEPVGDLRHVFIAITTIKGIGVCKVSVLNYSATSISWNLFLMEEDPKRLEVVRHPNKTFLLAQTDNNLYICDVDLMNLENWQDKKVQILPAIKVKLSSKIVYNKSDVNIALGYSWKVKINNNLIYFQKLHPPMRQPFLPQ